ncbi:MAG: hypothetical protein KF678_08110 [Phycisphaeraceae bacterium]|nr:hypothetical protein [Phycisphaeraceae bacterium]
MTLHEPQTVRPSGISRVEHRLLLDDTFSDPRSRGSVVGSPVLDARGGMRLGVDVERVMSIDHGKLRIEPLARPGWGRAGIAYGPYQRVAGLALAVKIDNGHNMSQTCQLRSWIRQTVRWFRGSETDPPYVRLLRWVGHRPRMTFARKLHRWYESRTRSRPLPTIRENLAVGFFPSPAPTDPLPTGNGLGVHASEVHDNGELWAGVRDRCVSACTSLQNLTMYYIVVLREQGAVYYAASLPGAHAVGGYPEMRPVAVDPFNVDRELYAGVHQAVLGEIGFTMDTRVHGVRVADLGESFHTGHAADGLLGEGPLEGSPAAIGGSWRGEGFERTAAGVRAVGPSAIAWIETGLPSGLTHVMITPAAASRPPGVAFRMKDRNNLWAFFADDLGSRLAVCLAGEWKTIAEGGPPLVAGRPSSVQVLDDGKEFTISVDGVMAFGKRIADLRLGAETRAGLIGQAADGESRLRDFEAHPRQVPMPTVLDMGPPWKAEGTQIRVRDLFTGPNSDLARHETTYGGREWRHDIGRGTFEITGNGSARVNASIGVPSPGRTVYTIPWDEPDFADVDVEMTPPGTRRGETHRGRSGFVFWQDRLNYFMINLWLHDNLETTSISTFFCINGFDDLYDAIWTCTGPVRMTWGVPFRLRAVFDGDNFLIRVNGEPVLYRSLSDVYPREPRMKINRVGLLANWEWGTDTGTVFRDFIVRGR